MAGADDDADDAEEAPEDRVARLRRELADAELEVTLRKLDEEMCDAAGAFLQIGEESTDVEEIRTALDLCQAAWRAFETWQATRRAEKRQLTVARPYLAMVGVPPLAVTDEMREGERRPPGKGSIQPTGKGFQWRLHRDGKLTRSKTWPTRAEAEIELALFVADPAFEPVAKDRKRLQPTKHTCSKCHQEGHKAPRCPQTEARKPAPPPEPAPPAPVRLSLPDAADADMRPSSKALRKQARDKRLAAARASLPVEEPQTPIADAPDVDDGDGWGPADAAGVQVCLPCKGEGVDNRPGEGAGLCCLNCLGDGSRLPEPLQLAQ